MKVKSDGDFLNAFLERSDYKERINVNERQVFQHLMLNYILGVCRGGSRHPKYPNFRGPIYQYFKFLEPKSQYPKFSEAQNRNGHQINIPISTNLLLISQYPNLWEALSQYSRENDQYPNIPIWLTPPIFHLDEKQINLNVHDVQSIFIIDLFSELHFTSRRRWGF